MSNDGLVARKTFTTLSTDTAAALSTTDIADSTGVVAKKLLITFETNSIRCAYGGTTPTTTATTAIGHLMVSGDSMEIQGASDVKSLKIISAVAGAHGRLNCTVFT